ncbi:hypothetical protein ACN28S_55095 [Cystobacter fuscus]
MSSSSTAPLAPETALLRVPPPPEETPLRRAELRLQELLAEIDALDAEIDALGGELQRFARAYEDTLSAASDTVSRSERLLRRLRHLQDAASALIRLLEQPPQPPTPADARQAPAPTSPRVSTPPPLEDEDEDTEDFDDEDEDDALPEGERAAGQDAREAEEEAVDLKRLRRRPARLLHPDFAQTDEERERLDGLMARVNAAYSAGDRTTLEMIAARVGAGEPEDTLTEDARLAHLERRIQVLSTAAHSCASSASACAPPPPRACTRSPCAARPRAGTTSRRRAPRWRRKSRSSRGMPAPECVSSSAPRAP